MQLTLDIFVGQAPPFTPEHQKVLEEFQHPAAGVKKWVRASKVFRHAPTRSWAKVDFRGHPETGKTVAYLAHFYTSPDTRGQGGGERVMQQVTAHLDKHQIPAVLHAAADRPQDQKRLENYYGRHGFHAAPPDYPGDMVRLPNPNKS